MSFIKEFKEFAMRGSVVDLAVGVIIGGALGKIVSSFVDDILMPPIGWLIGGVDFSNLKWIIQDGKIETNPETGLAETIGEVSVMYGSFLTSVIDFLIIAFAIFLMVKAINNVKRKQEEAPAEPGVEEKLLTEIRDLLKENK